MKRICILLLAVLLVMGALPVSAFAAAEVSVAQKASELESKYGIDIKYATNSSGGSVVTASSLEILDMALENITPAVVKQVSSYYKGKNGTRLTYSYKQAARDESAGFSDSLSLIELYFPESGRATNVTGENPLSIIHEFGHAFHIMCLDSVGLEKMRSEWSAFNGGIAYSQSNMSKNPDENTFISAYASTDFYEDVAETFAHVMLRSRAGQGFKNRLTSGGAQTGLGKKVAYVEQLISTYITESAPILANYRRIYDTATTMTYQTMKFSGDYLVYAGYAQPRFMLNIHLDSLGIAKSEAMWIRAIGGWYVKTTDRQELIIFPDGKWADVSGKSLVPTAS